MATIEDRADEYATHIVCFKREGKKVLVCEKLLQGCTSCERKKEAFEQFVEITTEQDRIARQEERERCIQRAQLRECKMCKDNDKCWLCDDCTIMQDVRKAIEGGEG